MRRLYWAAAVSTFFGLVGGLYYRELTKALAFSGDTQLAVVHTHLLALGTLVFLALMALEKALALSRSPLFPWFFWIYCAGLAWVVTFLAINGSRTVLGHEETDALAGMAGMGHVLLAVGFVLFFLVLRARAVTSAETASMDAPVRE